MQVRYATDLTDTEYAALTAWQDASPPPCPFHPSGGCQLAGHGTYARKTSAGVRLRRLRCRKSGRTVSLLSDWLASNLPSPLAEVVRRAEQAPRRAVPMPRMDSSEPVGSLHWRVPLFLSLARSLYPDRFGQLEPILAAFGVALGTATDFAGLWEVAAAQLARYRPRSGSCTGTMRPHRAIGVNTRSAGICCRKRPSFGAGRPSGCDPSRRNRSARPEDDGRHR